MPYTSPTSTDKVPYVGALLPLDMGNKSITTIGGVNLAGDNVKLGLGNEGVSDSYIAFTGSVLDFVTGATSITFRPRGISPGIIFFTNSPKTYIGFGVENMWQFRSLPNIDQVSLGLHSNGGRQLVLTDDPRAGNDYAHATQTNPTFFVQSATPAGTDLTEWGSLSHTGTGSGDGAFTILSGTGEISFGDENVSHTGDLYWTGDGSGLAYGHIYTNTTIAVVIGDNNPTEVDIAGTADVYTEGELNLITFTEHYLIVTKAGRYKVDWSMSVALTGAANVELEGGIMIGGSARDEGQAHRTVANTTDTGALCGTAILDLAANNQISLFVQNESGTTNINVEHANLVITMVGGT